MMHILKPISSILQASQAVISHVRQAFPSPSELQIRIVTCSKRAFEFLKTVYVLAPLGTALCSFVVFSLFGFIVSSDPLLGLEMGLQMSLGLGVIVAATIVALKILSLAAHYLGEKWKEKRVEDFNKFQDNLSSFKEKATEIWNGIEKEEEKISDLFKNSMAFEKNVLESALSAHQEKIYRFVDEFNQEVKIFESSSFWRRLLSYLLVRITWVDDFSGRLKFQQDRKIVFHRDFSGGERREKVVKDMAYLNDLRGDYSNLKDILSSLKRIISLVEADMRTLPHLMKSQ